MEAYEQGINYYDTAYMYPDSEETLGKVLEKHNIRSKVYIATKLPHSMCRVPEDIEKYFQIELKRLRTDYIDYYLIHNVTELGQWEQLCKFGIMEWIAEKKASGIIRQIGFSFHGPYNEFEKMLNVYDWDFVQIQYNYININYQAGLKGLNLASEKGLPVMIMEPLLGGKLAASLPKEATDLFQKAKADSTPVSWALRWVWNHPAVTLLLSGMNEPKQLEENIKLANSALPHMMSEKELATIQQAVEVFNKSYKVRCTGCNYCMPCPKGINIPGMFAAYNESYAISKSIGRNKYIINAGMVSKTPHFASDCISCGQCMKKCPQSIDIPQNLKQVRRRLQFPGMPLLFKIAKKVMR